MIDGLSVRGYRDEDLEGCRSLWEQLTQVHRDIYEDPGIGGASPGMFFDSHLSRIGPENIWVACVGDELIGLMGLESSEDEITIEPLIVGERWRGKGVGSALVRKAIAQARSKNVRYLGVRPVARNSSAIKFFRGSGMKNLGHIELFMDLQGRSWKDGLDIHGLRFEY